MWSGLDLGHERVRRFADNLRSDYLGDEETQIATPFGPQRPRLHPHAAGLADRLWYGGDSQRSARWAGQNGSNLLTGNVISGEGTDDFVTAQLNLIETFRRTGGAGRRVALGRVIVPHDSAVAGSVARYQVYAQSRQERIGKAHGEKRTLFAPDLTGTADEILLRLKADPVLADVEELRLELPYEFSLPEYRQILTDFVERIAPELGWIRQP